VWHENSIHVKVGFRPGSPEVTMRNRLLGSIKSSPQHQKLFDGPAGAIHPTLGPELTTMAGVGMYSGLATSGHNLVGGLYGSCTAFTKSAAVVKSHRS